MLVTLKRAASDQTSNAATGSAAASKPVKKRTTDPGVRVQVNQFDRHLLLHRACIVLLDT